MRDVKHEIGRRYSFAQLSSQVDAHHFRRQKINRLPEHAGFRFDSADAPAHDAETINHGRMRISADERVGEVNS